MCEFLNCPICEAEASDLCPCGEVEPCTCYDGWIYMDDFGKILTKEQYDALPEDERLKDNCPICNEGQIFGKNVTFNGGCMVACGIRKHTLSIYNNANRRQEL